MRAWLKHHERALWWWLLAASIVVGLVRHPDCAAATPWWVYAGTGALMVGMTAWTVKLMRDLRALHAEDERHHAGDDRGRGRRP